MINETFNLCTFQSSKIRNYSSDDSMELDGHSREFKLPHTVERNAIKVKRLSRTQSKNLKLEMWDNNSNPKSPFSESDKSQKSPKDSNPWEITSGPTASAFVDCLEVDVSKLSLREVIARGSYGVTYLASYEGSDAAVKMLEWGEEDTMSRAHLSVLKKSFAQEAELWNQLSHPNLAKYKGAAIPEDGLMIPRLRKGRNGEIYLDGNACCIVLEHMPGGCLRDFLIRQSPKKLSVRQRMKLALEAASGLAYLHSKGITHYAIKSENLMMDKRGVVKIADFGSGSKGSVSYYESNSSNGMDISSIAPEVIKGARYTEKSDVYAFGYCLFEIFLCNVPLSDKLIHEGLLSQKTPKLPSHFPQKLTGILANCWETSPHNRPSMKDVLAYLKFVSQEMEKSSGLLKYIRKLRAFT